ESNDEFITSDKQQSDKATNPQYVWSHNNKFTPTMYVPKGQVKTIWRKEMIA
ncbi:27710_t:CDS:1, partial [Gigaspora margarita]